MPLFYYFGEMGQSFGRGHTNFSSETLLIIHYSAYDRKCCNGQRRLFKTKMFYCAFIHVLESSKFLCIDRGKPDYFIPISDYAQYLWIILIH